MTPLILTAQEGGERLDAFVAGQVEELTRSAAQRLLEQGAVTSGGKPLKKNAKTTPGMVVEVLLPDPILEEFRRLNARIMQLEQATGVATGTALSSEDKEAEAAAIKEFESPEGAGD